MEENLLERAKSMIVNFTPGNKADEEEAEIIKQAIQAASSVATAEEQEELEQLERQLNELS